MNRYTVICPGCGWTGQIGELAENGACPECSYENGAPPYRLLTLKEMLRITDVEYADIRMDLFLTSLLGLLGVNSEKDIPNEEKS